MSFQIRFCRTGEGSGMNSIIPEGATRLDSVIDRTSSVWQKEQIRRFVATPGLEWIIWKRKETTEFLQPMSLRRVPKLDAVCEDVSFDGASLLSEAEAPLDPILEGFMKDDSMVCIGLKYREGSLLLYRKE
ncbi:MAG: hypothetical protein KBC64_00160 [Simkaniaceae bacterium]|nr:hypothetical protein [Simkaniaceae bacterium]